MKLSTRSLTAALVLSLCTPVAEAGWNTNTDPVPETAVAQYEDKGGPAVSGQTAPVPTDGSFVWGGRQPGDHQPGSAAAKVAAILRTVWTLLWGG